MNSAASATPAQAIRTIGDEDALSYISRYFEMGSDGHPRFTGSQFETFAGGGDGETANEITAEDLIAVSTLAVHVPGRAALAILGMYRDEISRLLQEIPVEWRLECLTDDEFAQFSNRSGAAQRLWDILRNHARPWRVGPTTASKVLARKRPHLVPVYDSVIKKRVGLRSSADQWDIWWKSLRLNDGELTNRLERIRAESGQTHLSLLRTLDIVLWMDGRSRVSVQDLDEDEVEVEAIP